MSLLVAALVSQAVMAQAVDSSWWVPDLLIAGLVLGIVRQPSRWALLSITAGFGAMVWAIRMPSTIAGSVLILGWAVRAAHAQWDLSDRRVQGLLAGIASAAMTGVAVWGDDRWSLPIMGWLVMRATLTGLIAWWLASRNERRSWQPG